LSKPFSGIVLKFSGALALALPALTQQAAAQVACAYDRPCITRLYISNTDALMLTVKGSDYDVLQLRWSRPGRDGNPREFRGVDGTVTVLKKTTAGVTYTVAIQGCNRRVLQRSQCTGWERQQIKAY
jgi:hypothetical protein